MQDQPVAEIQEDMLLSKYKNDCIFGRLGQKSNYLCKWNRFNLAG